MILTLFFVLFIGFVPLIFSQEKKEFKNEVGFMVGYQLPLSNHFNLDFIIAVPGAGYYMFKLNDKIPPTDEF